MKNTSNNSGEKLYQIIVALEECNKKHCTSQKEKLEAVNMKFRDERKKLMKQDITDKQFLKKMLAIDQKINKTDEKIHHIECQLKNCHKQTRDIVMHSIHTMLKRINKKTEPKKYDVVMKYKKLFSNKVEKKDLIKFYEVSYSY
jgi:hypothetical protein